MSTFTTGHPFPVQRQHYSYDFHRALWTTLKSIDSQSLPKFHDSFVYMGSVDHSLSRSIVLHMPYGPTVWREDSYREGLDIDLNKNWVSGVRPRMINEWQLLDTS